MTDPAAAPGAATLTVEEATQLVLDALHRVAPDVDPATVDPDEELAAGCDLDSMDFLTLVENVSARVRREIPERDYPQIATLRSFATYLTA